MKYLDSMDRVFKEIYLQMLFESAGIVQFDYEKYLDFLKTVIKFKDGKIITEDKDLLIDVPINLINYCYDNQKKLIGFDKIKDFMKESKHYRNIKNVNGYDLFFMVFDFNNDTEITEFHRKFFNNLANDSLTKMEDDFKTYCSKIDGFFNIYENKAVCVVNALSKNISNTIYHELSHFIQTICNIRIVKDFKFDKDALEKNERFKKLKEIDVTLEKLNYYYSNTEFSTHVDDLAVGLFKTFLSFYKDKFEFISDYMAMIRYEIITNKDFINSKITIDYKRANNGDIAPLIMFAASYYFNHKYQHINDTVIKILERKYSKYLGIKRPNVRNEIKKYYS